jgi:hypothetical protein
MVQTLCKICSDPQGITHSVAAYWLAPKQDADFPNIVAVRTNVLDVYSILHSNGKHAANGKESHCPSHTLQLEHTQALQGQVQAIACLNSRRAGHRDSIVLVFDAVRPRPQLTCQQLHSAACYMTRSAS